MEARSQPPAFSNYFKSDEMNFIFLLDAFSWKAMQRTTGRSAFELSMTSTFNQQPRALSPAVADLMSR
jgi:hypothetical protein